MIKLDGVKLAGELQKKLAAEAKNLRIALGIIQVGDDAASSIYVKRKMTVCGQLGIETRLFRFPETAKQGEITGLVRELNADPGVNGVLVQLPLPKRMDVEAVLRAIDPLKDVDAFNKRTLRLKTKGGDAIVPCLVGAIQAFAKKYRIDLDGKRIVVVGKGRAGGRPIVEWYKKTHEVVALDKTSKKIAERVAQADVLVAAVGNPGAIDSSSLKKGCVFFDVGINRVPGSRKVVGDIDFAVAGKRARYGTPVPGGIGPLTIIMLLRNLINLAKIQNEKPLRRRI